MTGWLYLFGAIILEVCGTLSMKLSEGFTRILPSVMIFVFYVASLFMLTLAIKRIDVSTAYAVWAGLGTTLIAVAGFICFKEPVTVLKVLSIALIIIGVVGLNVTSGKV
jgi:small multidrug resistance pump